MTAPITTVNQNIVEPLNFRNVWSLQALESPYVSMATKIAIVATLVLSILAAALSMGLIAATIAASFFGVVIGSTRVLQDLKRENASLKVDLMMSFAPVRLTQFLTLDLGDRESETGEINFIQINEVQAPKKGVDKYGRQFYAFTVERRRDLSPHVLVIYQKYPSSDVWAVSGPEGIKTEELTAEGRYKIGCILRRNDADFEILADLGHLEREAEVSVAVAPAASRAVPAIQPRLGQTYISAVVERLGLSNER